MKPEFDEVSGQETTGHEWNGIKELNTPMPWAFRIWLWASIAVAALLWVLYPSFPSTSDYLKGTIGYSSREAVNVAVAEGEAKRAEAYAVFTETDPDTLAEDETLQAKFEDDIAVLYRDNCAVCHGRDLEGQANFPNLVDDHWLWSGWPEEIEYTLQVGINSNHEDTRFAEMPAFGRNEMLPDDEISDIVEYVLSISGQEHDAEAALRGDELFLDNCSGCHAEGGVGGFETGAPSLVDDQWIYGGSREEIAETLENGRAGVMPAWSGRLSETEIRQLTLYLIWQGREHGDS